MSAFHNHTPQIYTNTTDLRRFPRSQLDELADRVVACTVFSLALMLAWVGIGYDQYRLFHPSTANVSFICTEVYE